MRVRALESNARCRGSWRVMEIKGVVKIVDDGGNVEDRLASRDTRRERKYATKPVQEENIHSQQLDSNARACTPA